MSSPEDTLRHSPVDFETAVAYALHPEMRRLLIIYAVGSLLVPLGLGSFASRPLFTPLLSGLIQQIAGLAIAVAGALLLFAGLVGAAFKVVTDANVLAAETTGSRSQ